MADHGPQHDRPDDRLATAPVQQLQVYPARAFRVAHGVNLGDPFGIAPELEPEDVYELSPDARLARLAVAQTETGLMVAEGSELGQAGAPLYLDHLATLMATNGEVVEVLAMVETDPGGMIAAQYVLPFTPLSPGTGYALVTIDRDAAPARLAQMACVSFARGTHITMGDGRQVKVEDLRPGDRILTRDSGKQELRWIGQQTLRATGAFAPITLAAGALNNSGELTLSPNHRLFVYQRTDQIGAGQSEVLVRARDLVNGTTVIQSEGGFVDYFQLLFDKHEIIYAEGIASESLFIDPTIRPALPGDLPASLTDTARPTNAGHEIGPRDASGRDTIVLLKRASSG
ncbi:MAG TPA: Hint domain-containing protein [Aliiroseovarius sp.]|nr:Hint domain-containing protein [Aliiroseovarius sp.]